MNEKQVLNFRTKIEKEIARILDQGKDLLSERERIRLKLLKDALSRIERGLFGICEGCKEKIPEKRLELNPTASHCIECQKRAETNTSQIRRRLSRTFQ